MKSFKTHFLFLLEIIFAVTILCSSLNVYSQAPGCKDPMANNYNAAATVNDGSCTYDVTSYTPPIQISLKHLISYKFSFS